MRTNVIIFALIGCFVTVVGVVYTLLTLNVDPGGIEWVGVPALFALAAMCWMIAIYVWMNERRFGGGAQDDDDAEVHEGLATRAFSPRTAGHPSCAQSVPPSRSVVSRSPTGSPPSAWSSA